MSAVAEYVWMFKRGYRVCCKRELSGTELGAALKKGQNSLVRKFELVRVPSSDTATVFKIAAQINGQFENFYYKEHHFRDFKDVIKCFFRSSRAMRALRGTKLLSRHGFYAPEIIAAGEKMTGPIAVSSFTVTREVSGLDVYKYWREIQSRGGGADSIRRKFAAALGRVVGQMHAAKIVHGDLRMGNVMVIEQGEDFKFYFLDNERTSRLFFMTQKQRLKNLVQINMFRKAVSNSDRLRFLKSYAQASGMGDEWVREIIEKIQGLTHKRLRKKGRA